jgi:Tfp pilus assembly protein PilZ
MYHPPLAGGGPQERRSLGRKAVNFVVRMSTPHGLFFGSAQDVGLGGICIESDTALPVGTSALLTFRLFPDKEEPLRVRGRICWVEPSNTPVIHRLGLTFEELSEEAARDIELFFSAAAELRQAV